MVKALSIKHFIQRDLIPAIKTKSVSPTFFQYGLPINILEAKMLDMERGNIKNARVALELAKEKPGSKEGSQNVGK